MYFENKAEVIPIIIHKTISKPNKNSVIAVNPKATNTVGNKILPSKESIFGFKGSFSIAPITIEEITEMT